MIKFYKVKNKIQNAFYNEFIIQIRNIEVLFSFNKIGNNYVFSIHFHRD